MRFSYPPPANEADFERLCLALLRRHWSLPRLELYAHRGEKQHGVDIIDMGANDPLTAAQCKLHNSRKALTTYEVCGEVDKAKTFSPPLGRYAMLSTAKKTKTVDDKVIELNRAHQAAGLFSIEVVTWEALEALLDAYPEVRETFYNSVSGQLLFDMHANVQTIRTLVERTGCHDTGGRPSRSTKATSCSPTNSAASTSFGAL